MTRKILPILGILFALSFIWALWIYLVNTRVTVMDIHVAGIVDEVDIYQEHEPHQPVGQLYTNGEDLSIQLALPNAEGKSFLVQRPPVRYYFVAVKGDETYRGNYFCCSTSFMNRHGSLMITDLGEYETSQP